MENSLFLGVPILKHIRVFTQQIIYYGPKHVNHSFEMVKGQLNDELSEFNFYYWSLNFFKTRHFTFNFVFIWNIPLQDKK